jgi:hypothetical protein
VELRSQTLTEVNDELLLLLICHLIIYYGSEYFVTKIRFCGELLAPRPTPKLENHPLSAVRDCLFNIFAATLLSAGRSSIRNPRTRLAEVGHVSRMGRREACTGFWWGNVREREQWGDPGENGRIILGWVFRKRDVGVWTGLGWLRIERGDRQL